MLWDLRSGSAVWLAGFSLCFVFFLILETLATRCIPDRHGVLVQKH